MDRRLFITGLLGVVGTTGVASVLPRQAQALAAVPLGGPAPKPDDLLPELPKLPESGGPLGELDEEWEWDEGEEPDEGGFELASHRRRRRRRRWHRVCRRYWHNGHWRRRCHRRPFWIWLWI
jgi:hypothetical protein